MKNLLLGLSFCAGIVLFSCEGNVEESVTIPACENLTSSPDCDDCCATNGYDDGIYSSIDSECKCLETN